MKMDSSSLNIIQNTYQEDPSFRWIVQKNTDNSYQIISAKDSYGALGMGSADGTITYLAAVKSTGTNNLFIDDNGDGSYSISMMANGKTYYLESNTSANGECLVWTTQYPLDGSQSWYLEPYALMRCDVNADGTISTVDYTTILNYTAEMITFNNQQKFLADANGDGRINTTDARLTLQIASGLIV